MISHEYKCIFVHIQRCAGTSIEKWISGKSQWLVDKTAKHLLASQAKKLYAPYWDEYFKFAIVRNPYTRMVSCLKFAEHFGLAMTEDGELDFRGYHRFYGQKIIVENDRRFSKRADLLSDRHVEGQVYGNILDEDLDFIAKFETIDEDMRFLAERLGIPTPFEVHAEKSNNISKPKEIGAATRAKIRELYFHDFEHYGYPID